MRRAGRVRFAPPERIKKKPGYDFAAHSAAAKAARKLAAAGGTDSAGGGGGGGQLGSRSTAGLPRGTPHAYGPVAWWGARRGSVCDASVAPRFLSEWAPCGTRATPPPGVGAPTGSEASPVTLVCAGGQIVHFVPPTAAWLQMKRDVFSPGDSHAVQNDTQLSSCLHLPSCQGHLPSCQAVKLRPPTPARVFPCVVFKPGRGSLS